MEQTIITELRLINQRLTALENKNSTNGNIVDRPTGRFGQSRRPTGRWEGDALVFRRQNSNQERQGQTANPAPRRHRSGHRPITSQNRPTLDDRTLELSRALYQSIQLRHHARNWEQIPEKLSKQIDFLYNNVVPPMPSENVRAKLVGLGEEAKSNLVATIMEHIVQAQAEVKVKIESCGLFGDEFDAAASAARGRLISHFRRRIPVEQINRWLSEDRIISEGLSATEEMARLMAEGLTSQNQNQELEEWGTINRGGNKRPAQSPKSSPDIEISNRFQALETEEEGMARGSDDDEQVSPQISRAPARKKTKTSPPKRSRANSLPPYSHELTVEGTEVQRDATETATGTKNQAELHAPSVPVEPTGDGNTALAPQRQEQSSNPDTAKSSEAASTPTRDEAPDSQGHAVITTEGTVTAHQGGAKKDWGITLKDGTEVLIVGDSNMRYARHLPSQWEVHVFPGAYLSHVATIIENLNPPNSLKSIVVAAGINNRTWKAAKDVRHDVHKIHNVTERVGVAIHFLGISMPPQLPSGELQQLRDLNKAAKDRFKQRYIEPVSKVSVSPTDLFRIHYDQVTVDRIIENINKHFLSVSRSGRGIPM